MSFQLSAGVVYKEIDLTNSIPAVSSSIGALTGGFNDGPINKIVTITNENDLVNVFGQPDNSNYLAFFQASSFLKFGSNLKVVRVSTGHLNATANGAGLAIDNDDVYEEDYMAGEAAIGSWAAKSSGTIGNGIKVEVCPADSALFDAWAYKAEFDEAPGTSSHVSDRGGSADELHIVVVDTIGVISGLPGTILERFAFVSQASDAKKDDGTSNFYKNVVNTGSGYVYWMDHDTLLTSAGTASTGTTFATSIAVLSDTLTGGIDGTTGTAETTIGLDMFSDAATVDVNLLIAPVDTAGAAVMAKYAVETIAEGRKDVVAFVSPPIEATVGSADPLADVIAFGDVINSSSYGVADSTAVKVYDKYNDVYRWIPANGLVAGLCANTDRVADAWFSPAGLNRGQLPGVTKVAFNPKQAHRDDLYKRRINPIVSFPGEGTVLYGDKTLLARPSAFDRINVRRLFIILEKAIATASKFQLFELNDEFTRAQFRSMVEPFLRDVKGRRGITDFLVICDETNNTGEVVDTNRFVADIYIKPARSINFINLNFIATRTGVEFSEIVGK